MSDLFGFGIDGLDLPRFLALSRLAFVAAGLAGALLAARGGSARRAGRIVLAVALLGHAIAWFATMHPLSNPYGANGSMDRENHLGWANVVSNGFPILRTFQVHHLHFEPLWPLLSSIAAGFNPDHVPAVFQWQPLVMGFLLLFSVRYAWLKGGTPSPAIEVASAFAALGAVLLLAVPGDHAGALRNPWALTLLLKPNHTLGLVLAPLAALVLSRAGTWKSRLWAGFVLQLVGWAFVIHMVLFVAGLFVFVALSWIEKRADRLKDALDAGVAVGANLLIVSPYLIMLLVAYPFRQTREVPGLLFSERPIEAALRIGVFFALSVFGAWRAYRGGSRLGRILASQWLAAHLVWQAFPLLSLVRLAREQDEAFYWCRFWTGLFAGLGLFEGLSLALAALKARARAAQPGIGPASALGLLILMPSLVPAWWDPSTMDKYFIAARKPIPDWIVDPMKFVRENTAKDAVFAGDRNYARWIAAYGQRRVLLSDSLNRPGDSERRMAVEGALLGGGDPALVEEGRARYALRYVLHTSAPTNPAMRIDLDVLKGRPHLEPVYDRTFDDLRVVILRIRERGETGARP